MNDFDRAIALNSKFSSPYLGRGEVYFVLERYDEALHEINKSLELYPYKQAYMIRGNLYTRLAELTDNTNERNEYSERARADFERGR
jgi:tetratricopeptide (TPR) repeat protein